MGQTKLTSADGFKLDAYQQIPAGDVKGGVVVIQEIFGVNAHIREVVDGYANAGYAAIAPAIFDRSERNVELGYDEAGMSKGIALAFQQFDHEAGLNDIAAAVQAMSEYGKVGVVGYCFGGLMTWISACEVDGIAAAASYYGGGIGNEAGLTPKCPIILHFGKRDQHIPESEIGKVKAAHPDVPVYMYEADHGFNCDHRGSYDADSAKTALERTLTLFGENLA